MHVYVLLKKTNSAGYGYGHFSMNPECVIGRPRIALQWRHNGRDGDSNHQPRHCLLNRLFGRRSKKTSKLRVTDLRAGNSPVTREFPAQMSSYAENVSIWWRHHVKSAQRKYGGHAVNSITIWLMTCYHVKEQTVWLWCLRQSIRPLHVSHNMLFLQCNIMTSNFSPHHWPKKNKLMVCELL